MSTRDDAMEQALRFCYALLAPGQDAAGMLAANPDRAAAAHRALYERKPRAEGYDAMMARVGAPTVKVPPVEI